VGLQDLHLGACWLRALPEGIGGLIGLRQLDLSSHEELTTLPDGLCTLTGLEELHLHGCGLTVLPEGIGGLTGLRMLDLGFNEELTVLPNGLGRLPNLEMLRLYGCPGLAAFRILQQREGLPALLAHLATQGGPVVGVSS
jgi:hypothetical protein